MDSLSKVNMMASEGYPKKTTLTLASLILIALIISVYSIWNISTSIALVNNRLSNLSNSINELNYAIESISESVKELEKPKPFPVTLTDALQRIVIIDEEPKTIVSMAPSVTEMLFALGLGDKVIGVTSYCNYPPEVLDLVKEGKIEVIGGFTNPSIEKIVELNPDLVIAGSPDLQARFVYKLESLGITVLTLKSDTISDIYNSLILVGKATGKYEEAANLINQLKSQIRAVWSKVGGVEEKVKVLHIVWFEPLMVAGGKSYINDLISMAGGENVFGDVNQGYPMISPETVLEKQPDVIIVSGHAYPGKSPEEIIEYLQTIPGWSELKALKEGRVYVFLSEAEDVLVRSGPRVGIAVQLLAKVFYPEVFQVTVPQVITEAEI